MRRLAALALLLILPTLLACSATASYAWKDERAIEYRVGSGDRLRISVWKHDEVSNEVTVRPDGNFSLPLVGDVHAAGRSPLDIGKEVEGRLTRLYTEAPPVTVLVVEVKSYRLYVLGEVQKPGELAPGQPITVLMALAMAGGFTPFADSDHVVIVRRDDKGERRIPFSWSAVVRGGDLQQNLLLQAGDTLVVP
jgi:polysaccharide export outer membrane protein